MYYFLPISIIYLFTNFFFNLILFQSQGTMVLMMGTKEEDVVKEPEIKPVFVEDMNETELASSVSNLIIH